MYKQLYVFVQRTLLGSISEQTKTAMSSSSLVRVCAQKHEVKSSNLFEGVSRILD